MPEGVTIPALVRTSYLYSFFCWSKPVMVYSVCLPRAWDKPQSLFSMLATLNMSTDICKALLLRKVMSFVMRTSHVP